LLLLELVEGAEECLLVEVSLALLLSVGLNCCEEAYVLFLGCPDLRGVFDWSWHRLGKMI
jgi:hypothetical protein